MAETSRSRAGQPRRSGKSGQANRSTTGTGATARAAAKSQGRAPASRRRAGSGRGASTPVRGVRRTGETPERLSAKGQQGGRQRVAPRPGTAARRVAPPGPSRRGAHPRPEWRADPGALAGSRIAAALVAAPAVVALGGAVLLALGAWAAGAVLLLAGGAWSIASLHYGSPRKLAERVGGRPAEAGGDARLVNLVEGASVLLGLRTPRIAILDDPAPNAVALGPDGERAVLVVTSGLLSLLDRIELEGVVTHELAHVRRGDLVLAASATRALGLAAALSPAAARAVLRLAGPERESRADLRAAGVTRYPPGLSAALEKLAGAPSVRPAGLDTATARLTAALWCAGLDEARSGPARRGVLGAGERAAGLREL